MTFDTALNSHSEQKVRTQPYPIEMEPLTTMVTKTARKSNARSLTINIQNAFVAHCIDKSPRSGSESTEVASEGNHTEAFDKTLEAVALKQQIIRILGRFPTSPKEMVRGFQKHRP